MFRWLRKPIGKWVYNRYYRSTVEFETSVYSGMVYTTDGTYIRMALPDDDKMFLAMPDGIFLRSFGGKTIITEIGGVDV